VVLEGVWDVRLPYGYQRSQQRPETAESPLPHIQAGQEVRHTNASQAFRGLQRFVNIRFRRYLTQRSKGRGFGWKRFPNSQLYAMGLTYIGSGLLEYRAKPAHGVR
jgi:hypothetical protein